MDVIAVRKQPPAHSSAEKNLRFLVVDDQPTARKMLRQVVSGDPSWSVIGEAANGEEAIALMDRKPDVVLIDM